MIRKPLNLHSISTMSLGALLIFFGYWLVYYAIKTVLFVASIRLDLAAIVRVIQLLPWLGLIPQVVGAVLLGYFILRSRFVVDKSETKKQLLRVFTIAAIFSIVVFSMSVSIPAVRADMIGTAHYHLDYPLPIADAYVGKFDNNTYFYLSGETWEVLGTSSNKDTIVDAAINSISHGLVYTSEVELSRPTDIPPNVAVIESYYGLQTKFINVTDEHGSPFLMSQAGSYHYIQDQESQTIMDFVSTIATDSFNNATTYLNSEGGGLLDVDAGTYLKYGNVSFTLENLVNVNGAGISTLFKGNDSAVGAVMQVYNQTQTEPTGFTLSNFAVDGNRGNCPNQTDGIYAYGTPEVIYDAMWITDTNRAGIYLHGIGYDVCDESIIQNSFFHRNTIAGIYVDYSNDLSFKDNIFRSNGNYSYDDEEDEWIVHGGAGMYLDQVHFSYFTGNKFLTNSIGLYLVSSWENVFSGNFYRNNLGDGAVLYVATYNAFNGEVFDVNNAAEDNDMTYNYSGCKLLGGSSVNHFVNCKFTDWQDNQQAIGFYDTDVSNFQNILIGCVAYGNNVTNYVMYGSGDARYHCNPA